MAADLCLPILKLSRATNAHSNDAVSWSHLTSADLYLTIQGDDVANTKLRMCIVERNNVLESLHLGSSIDAALEAQRRAQQNGVDLPSEQLPIFGMTKDALLALRYNTPKSEVRRLQLRMRTVDDCKLALRVLQRRGLEMQYLRSRTARPDTGASEHRLLTAQADSPYFADGRVKPQSAAFHLPPVEAGTFSQPRSTGPDRPQGPDRHDGPQEALHPQTPPMLRDQHNAPGDIGPARPATAAFYQSTPMKQRLSKGTLGLRFDQTKSHSHVDSNLPGGRSLPIPLPEQRSDTRSPRQPSPPTNPIFPETLEHEIPPRRELPFKRPESHRARSDRDSSRPRSAMELPPLPRPQLRDNHPQMRPQMNASLPPEKGLLDRPQTTSPSKPSWTLTEEDMCPKTGGKKATDAPDRRPGESDNNGGIKVLSPMEELISRQRPVAHQSSESRVLRLDSLLDAPHELESPASTPNASPNPPQQSSGSRLTESRDFTIGPTATAAPDLRRAEAASLSAYVSQSYEDRAAALDDFMASKLEDPSFTILCRDVENCWRRIALGL